VVLMERELTGQPLFFAKITGVLAVFQASPREIIFFGMQIAKG